MFEHIKEGNCDILQINGERMDAGNSPDFKSCVDGIVSQGLDNLIIDVSQVDFMDSSALGSLVSALKTVGNQRNLVMVGVHGLVEDLFKLTRMDRVFNMAENIEQAKQSLHS